MRDLRADFHTGAAADALLGIEVTSFTQVVLPGFSLVGVLDRGDRPPIDLQVSSGINRLESWRPRRQETAVDMAGGRRYPWFCQG
jgi:hypothetical protein